MYNENAVAIMLLCSKLRYDDENPPLCTADWNRLSRILIEHEIKPGELLNFDEHECCFNLGISQEQAKHICKRISNGDKVLSEIAQLEANDVFVITSYESDFPVRLKKKLGDECPPLLYYSGDIRSSNNHAGAVLGSRGVTEADTAFAKTIALKMTDAGYTVVTGGGDGIELDTERFVYSQQGSVIQFCAGDLLEKKNYPIYAQQIENGHLLMISAVVPKTSFSLEFARRRNKYIYANSDYAFIVNASKGGVTYTGATEALSNKICDVYCWSNDKYPANQELIKLGAKPINARFSLKSEV